MSSATLDRLLAVLLAAQVTTGLLTLRAGVPTAAPLFWLHGLLGGALLVAVFEKLRRSVGPAVRHRRWGRVALGSLLAALALAALAGGFAWVAAGRILSIGPWTILTLHIWAALALVPIVVGHLLPHRWRLLRPRSIRLDRSRRTLLATAAIAVLGVAAWGTANLLDRLGGGSRRFTGSRWLPDGGIPPPTTFFGEGTAPVDVATWRLRVDGRVERPLSLAYGELGALGEVEREEVLDCTSGWALRTTWRGVPLGSLLDATGVRTGAREVTVRAVTGWYARLPMAEAKDALLATVVAGERLAHLNGAPVRLVVPRRRGLEWVKWVDRIEIS